MIKKIVPENYNNKLCLTDLAILNFDLNGIIKSCNNTFLENFEYINSYDIENHNIEDLFIMAAEKDEIIDKIIQDKKILSVKAIRKTKNGSMLNVMETYDGLFDSEGNLLEVQVKMRHFCQKEKLESEILKANEHYKLILDNFPNPIRRSNKDNTFDFFNKSWLNFTGKHLKDEIGEGWLDSIHPDDYDYCVDMFKEAFKEIKPVILEYRLKYLKDNFRWISDHGSPYFDAEGNFNGFIWSCYDIDDNKRIVKELKNERNRVEFTNHIKDIILNNLGHELRTPLNGVLGFTQIMLNEATDEDTKENLNFIKLSGERLLNNLNLLLLLTDIESDRIKLNIGEIDLNKIAKYYEHTYKNQLERRDLQFEVRIKEGMVVVKADEYLTYKAIDCILDNAMKFTDKGKIILEISSYINNGHSFGEFSVMDTGIGIEPVKLETIFEPFRQVSEGSNRNYEGVGVGLTLAKKIIEKLNGYITVVSKPGIGSRFCVRLPLQLKN